ncbi:MAG: 5'-methylthioadenosine/adenosylhomocysteine nucleosidase [Treponema sp.]|nr:5'-methylthioadenosine/adenosylhomocysteine nucleosidase [Treponema sp.]
MADKIGIIGAMSVEVEQLKAVMQEKSDIVKGGLTFSSGLLGGKPVVVVQSGVGKVNAALCAQRLILEFGVSRIINTGIAGAMASGLGVLDFVVSTGALYHDMDATGFGYKVTQIPQMDVSVFEADREMVELAKSTFGSMEMSKGHKIVAGLIASGDQFISDRSRKEKIKSDCNPACVEMEGAAIAHACYLNKTPFVIIRCMSDMADDSGESTYDFNEKTAAELSATLVMKMLGVI